ncbi:MAG: hypothetical protein JWN34_5991 [Bryobacterales bacterium]|nr:hypothetical protein [Bryobacterales bacterium]
MRATKGQVGPLVYERWVNDWTSQLCPVCKVKIAHWRGLLFYREPPRSPRMNDRLQIGEIFLHADKTECRAVTDAAE